jgi:hypothetical protein
VRDKSEIYKVVKDFLIYVKRLSNGCCVKTIRTDNGTEFTSVGFEEMCKNNLIKHEYSVPGCPQQNGAAERVIQTLLAKIRVLLKDGNLPTRFWSEVALTAALLYNLTHHSVTNSRPFHMFTKNVFDYSKLRRLGCVAYTWVSGKDRSKLDDPGKKMLLLGYPENYSGYKLYDPTEGKTVISRNVKFIEQENYYQEVDSQVDELGDLVQVGQSYDNCDKLATMSNINVPKSYKQAVESKEKEEWKEAMDKEIQSLIDHQVFEEVESANGKKLIGTKWVFTIKDDLLLKHQIFKARLVAQGFSQKPEIDYKEIYSPVANFSTVLVTLVLAVDWKYKIHHFDVKTAFLNGSLDEEIFVKPPLGSEFKKIWKLKKSLYGLKQAPRCWFEHLKTALLGSGCLQSNNDPCCFFGSGFIITVYVDDMLIMAKDLKTIKGIEQALSKSMVVKDLGQLEKFCGLRVKLEKEKIILCQQEMIEELGVKFGLMNCNEKKQLIPFQEFVDYSTELVDNSFPVRSLLGSLQFIANRTRPDITTAVNYLARFQNSPSRLLWNSCKRVLRYLIGTKEKGLVVKGRESKRELDVFTDASQPISPGSASAITGVLVKMGNTPLRWFSRKQNLVATSTAESELYAMSMGIDESLNIHRLFEELTNQQYTIILHTDNQVALEAFKNKPKQKLRKIDIRTIHVLDSFDKGLIIPKYIPGADQLADYLTKPFKVHDLEKVLRSLLGNGGEC